MIKLDITWESPEISNNKIFNNKQPLPAEAVLKGIHNNGQGREVNLSYHFTSGNYEIQQNAPM